MSQCIAEQPQFGSTLSPRAQNGGMFDNPATGTIESP